jgi:uncharacterized protein YraI
LKGKVVVSCIGGGGWCWYKQGGEGWCPTEWMATREGESTGLIGERKMRKRKGTEGV